MLFHQGIWTLFKLTQFVLKEDESGVALTAVLGLESFPDFRNVFGSVSSRICRSMVFKRIHEVIVCQTVLVIPLINANLVRLGQIGLSD
jgi:hypothetical protein